MVLCYQPLKALHNTPHSHILTHTHKFGVPYPAQGHFHMVTVGAADLSTDRLISGGSPLPPEPQPLRRYKLLHTLKAFNI